MVSLTNSGFLTNWAWHKAVVGGKDLILRCTSALEFLELFGGYIREKRIDVYAKERGEYENLNYCVVDTFDDIDYFRQDGVLCTSVTQTVNDMLEDYDQIDEQSLLEGLSRYYFTHGLSFNGIHIKPGNMERFNSIKDWAIEYYNEG